MKQLSEEDLQQLAEEDESMPFTSKQSSALAAYQAVNDFLQTEEIPTLSQNFSSSIISKIHQSTKDKMGVLEWGAILITILVSFSCFGLAISWGNLINWETMLSSFFQKTFNKPWISIFCVLFSLLTWGNIETLFNIRQKTKKNAVS